jgi:hypothetical protein
MTLGIQNGYDLQQCNSYKTGNLTFSITASSDGKMLAFGQGRHLYLWTTVDQACSIVAELPEPIFSVTWFPIETQLLVLCGYPSTRTSLRGIAQPIGAVQGRYRVYVVDLHNGESRLIYADPLTDVLSVWPRLSSGGRFVVLKGTRRKAIIVATDGKGSRNVKLNHRCIDVMWLPEWENE